MTSPVQHEFVPGMWVVNPAHPEWGLGQVQSAVAHRVTVNFEHAGKLAIDIGVVALDVVDGPDARRHPQR
jgi:hypothetical protein